jgi:chemotaxis response regulator CheB
MSTIIRALIVDDSAFVRKVVREMLSRSPYIEVVGAARAHRMHTSRRSSMRAEALNSTVAFFT